ncbi:MAG: response regulator containing a CheY-like receiver domain and an DNA-binding domain [Flavipsychrobacter sp.]|nr:response regulator containing a CheY-like receiver domain and an DNA-binding domain [Flavipsychrobacter sp.]
MNTEHKINIILVDDHAIVLDGVEALLGTIPKLKVTGKAANGQAALDLMERETPNMIITDYSMEGMDCLTLIHNIKKNYPGVKIIVMTMHDEPPIVQSVLRAGAEGYILKKYTHHELLTAIEIIAEGGQFWSQEINKILLKKLQPEDTVQITDREMEVLKLLINEMNSRQIAEQLFISERTVDTHRKNLLRKTNSTNIVGLLKYAQAHGLI